MSECQCFAKISKEDTRYELWLKIYSENKLPLRHPHITISEGGPWEGDQFYIGDPSKLTMEQRKMLVEMMSKKFHISPIEVEYDLVEYGIPIKIDNVIITRCKKHSKSDN